MIISRGRNYIFVHIPKTGGTAMTMALEARAMADDIILSDTPKGRNRRRRVKDVQAAGRLWKHSTLADIEGLLDRDEIAAMLCFTMVRNPWDRAVSYYHWLRVQGFAHPAVQRAKAHDFTGFLRHPATAPELAASGVANYLRDGAGREVPALCLRLEHLAEDIAPLEAHLGFSPLPLPRSNASDRPADYRHCFDEAGAALVARACAADIARFGYRFEGQG